MDRSPATDAVDTMDPDGYGLPADVTVMALAAYLAARKTLGHVLSDACYAWWMAGVLPYLRALTRIVLMKLSVSVSNRCSP